MKTTKYQNYPAVLLVALLSSTLLLTACSGLTRSDKPATSTWLLKPYEGGTTATQAVIDVNISVTVTPGLDSDWILTLSTDAELSHYSGARWADNVPELVTSLTGRTLTESGRFAVVQAQGGGNNACDLRLEVQEFYASLGSGGQTSDVELAMSGQYQCANAEPVPIKLSASVPVHDERVSVIVAAFQQASNEVMKELLKQL